MCLGFSRSVLVLSLLTLVHRANAIGDIRGGHTRNSKLAFPSAFESSAQKGVVHGSSRSSHSAVGQVVGYNPEESVSSYGSSSLDVRTPTQNSQQSGQTNPDAKGDIQSKAGMWGFVSPKNVKRIASQQPGNLPKLQQLGYQAKPQQYGYQSPSIYQPQQPKPQRPGFQPKPQQLQQPVYQPKPQQPGYPSPSVFQPRPQQPGYQPKPQQYGYQSPSLYQQPKHQQPGYQPQQPKLQQPGYPSLSVYQPKPQWQIPKPTQNSQQSGQTHADAEGVVQTKAGMWDFVSPKNVKGIASQQPGNQAKLQIPGYQAKPQQYGYQSPSIYQPQQPKRQQPQQLGFQSPSVYQPQQPKPQHPGFQPKPQQPQQPGFQSPSVYQPQQPGFQPKRQQPQQPGFQSPPVYQPKPQQPGFQSPSVYQPQHPGFQPKPQQPSYPSLSVYQPKPQRQILKPTQNSQPSGQTNPDAGGVIETKAGMWDFVSPKNVQIIESQQAGYKPKPQQPGYQPKLQQYGYQSPSVYQPKPQRQIPKPTQNSQQSGQTNADADGVIQTKAGMWDLVSPKNGTRLASVISLSRGIVFKADPNTPSVSQPSVYQPKPHQVEIQMNAISEFLSQSGGVSGRNIQPTNLYVQMTDPPRTRGIRSRYSPRWQQSLVPV